MAFLDPVTLQGTHVTLTPTEPADAEGLGRAAADGELWTLQYTAVPRPEAMADWIATVLEWRAAGHMLPFTARRADGTIIGMTTFCHAEPAHRRVEVGYTWNAASAQRSGTNTESKLLLLRHAFEAWDCIAVEFRTHWLNRQSRAAIERLGARQEGVLRNHMIAPDGTLRDTVVYSVLAHEWPAVRAELQRRLAAH